jgi:hypothetical protein
MPHCTQEKIRNTETQKDYLFTAVKHVLRFQSFLCHLKKIDNRSTSKPGLKVVICIL